MFKLTILGGELLVKTCIIIDMAKRSTGIEKTKTSHSKKTKKRLEIKKLMLAKKAEKKKRK